MKEFNGTKGPWRARNGLETVDVEMPGDVIHDIGKIEDAWLIAASPDLLDALQDVLSGFESFIDAAWEATEEHDKERINKARAAIAKALGETK